MLYGTAIGSRSFIASAGQTDFLVDFPFAGVADMQVFANGVPRAFAIIGSTVQGTIILGGDHQKGIPGGHRPALPAPQRPHRAGGRCQHADLRLHRLQDHQRLALFHRLPILH